jgi:FkbM family methyltransferase
MRMAAEGILRRRVRVPLPFVQLVQKILRRRGFELVPYPVVDYADRRRQRLLRSRGISLVLDVGANVGRYAETLRTSGFSGRIVSFEPLAGPYSELAQRSASDSLWESRQLALGESDGRAAINVAANVASSSLLPMGPRHLQSAPESGYVGTEQIDTARLDSLWEDLVGPDDRVWLKLDVQGYELHALRGGGSVLERIDVIQAEMSLQHLYEGDVTWLSLIEWLDERGFRLAGLEPGFEDPESGELLQADGIFVRKS